jgi:hypothetical protein
MIMLTKDDESMNLVVFDNNLSFIIKIKRTGKNQHKKSD